MMKTLMTGSIIALLFPALAIAEETFDMSGVSKGSVNNTIHPIADGHMIIFSATEYASFELKDATNPLNGSTGTCSGAMELKVPAVSGSGHCVFTNKDGDKSFTRWEATGLSETGAITGTWTTVAGTGRFVDAKGGGAFSSLTDPETGKTANTISGDTTLK